jgi:LuxR family quorum-sensing transcriptional regulator LasR
MKMNKEMLDDFSVLARTAYKRDWDSQLRAVLQRIGYEHYLMNPGFSTINDPFHNTVTNYPVEWIRSYKDENLIVVDPILRHCRRHFVPLFWGPARRRARGGSVGFWRTYERHGLIHGVSIPLRYNDMSGSLSVVERIKPDYEFDQDLDGPLGKLFMLIPFMLEGARKHLSHPDEFHSDLTLREFEVLKWSGAGKTTWEISCILGCSERTINFHIANAIRKLGATNRRQAVCVAMARGLIAVE